MNRASGPLHQWLLAISATLTWLLTYPARTRRVKGCFHFGPSRPIRKDCTHV